MNVLGRKQAVKQTIFWNASKFYVILFMNQCVERGCTVCDGTYVEHIVPTVDNASMFSIVFSIRY